MKDLPRNHLIRLVDWWRESLGAENKSATTIRTYTDSVRLYCEYASAAELPQTLPAITPQHIRLFITDQIRRLSPYSALNRFRGLRSFFAWCVENDLIIASPMNGMKQPSVSLAPPPVISDEDLVRLIKACAGKTFEDYRDLAIIRLLLTGMRRGEIAGLRVEDLVFGKGQDAPSFAVVSGKTGVRNCPFGHKSARALLRYIYAREEHRDSHLPHLWLGYHGPMTDNGIYQVVKRRAAKAGLGKIYTHLFRHTAAHCWMAAGGNEHDLAMLMGWKGTAMVGRYGASAAAERAMAAHRKLLPDDRV